MLHVRGRGVEDADLAGYQGLVIGPGPMDPERAGLVEIVRAAAARHLPTLGICLGHQAIGMAFGARLVRTPPVHGKTTELQFTSSRWLPLAQGPWTVMRYHSLAVDQVKAPLRTTALSPEGVVMALEHQTLPILGLQFHPDSYASQRGPELLESFFRAAGVFGGGERGDAP